MKMSNSPENGKGEENFPSLFPNHVSDIQILQFQCVVVPKKILPNQFQTECLIIPVAITFGAEEPVSVARHVIFEETS